MNIEEIKRIPLEFKRDGLLWKQAERTDTKALYTGYPLRGQMSSKGVEWEIIVIRKRVAETLPSGTVLPLREVYPRTRDWGLYGWTHNDLERAMIRYNKTA